MALEAPQAGDDAAGDRIRVDAVRLYSDPALNQVERIALEQLIESPFNPRTHYDEQALQDLADTIRGVGVMQPILVRPVSYAQISHNGKPVQAYEIVFGHRRYRGARLAEEADVPAIVRELTDAQSAQLQAIENVQRKDLSALEEAQGYAAYLKAHAVTKDQLAKELGLSRSHVYSRLKLLTLSPQVQQSLKKGEIGPDVASYIGRLHTEKLQQRALSAIQGRYLDMEDGGKKSVRQIRELLRERFTLALSEAMFNPKDAQLLPVAGACTDCTKRTGNAPEYSDLAEGYEGAYKDRERPAPNLCTDPDCFEAKKKAHLRNKAQELEAKGKTVVTGNKAKAAIDARGNLKGNYIALKDVKAELAKANKGKDETAVETVAIQDPRTGKVVEAVKADDLKAAGVKVKAPKASSAGPSAGYAQQQKRYEEEQRQRREKARIATRENCALLVAVRRAAALVPRSAFDLQLVAMTAWAGVDYDERNTLAVMYGFRDQRDMEKKIGQMPVAQLNTLLLDCALVNNVVDQDYNNEKPDALLQAAKHYGVDVAAIRKDVAKLSDETKTEDLLKGVADPQASTAAPAAGEKPSKSAKPAKADKTNGGA